MPRSATCRTRQPVGVRQGSRAMKRLKVYTLKQCSTCRDATKWLREHAVEFEERPIRETPPSRSELEEMLSAYRGEIRRIFNTSGMEYRAQKLAERMDKLTADEAIAMLAGNGSLVKRPFVIGDGVALVGFDAAKWAAALQ